jgi:AAA+ superfamily predicted ATPase
MKSLADNNTQLEQVKNLLRAQVPIIWVVTPEENRFIELMQGDKYLSKSYTSWYWSASSGIVSTYQEYKTGVVCNGQFGETKPIIAALEKITDHKVEGKNLVAFMRDMHIVTQDIVARRLRDLYANFSTSGKTLIITSPFLAHVGGGGLHPLLEKQVVVVDYTLPSAKQIELIAKERLEEAFTNRANEKPNYAEDHWRQISKALQGLTIYEIENALATALCAGEGLDPEKLMIEKKQLIKKNQILEYVDTEASINDVGGLDLVKEYLIRYGDSFTEEAEKFGVEPLRGIIITGVAGTGKSLLAKSLSHLWKMPLIRLDVGRVMGRLVGDSEANMRSALNTVSSASPCLLWCDEIEKALSGTASSGQSDGGTLSRVFGTLLTAMQEGMEGVVFIATANNIAALPPELLRRFNEIFFVDLPGSDERWDIFKIHLAKRKRDIKNFIGAKKELLEASEGFTGAEIEKAVQAAIALAFYKKQKDVKPANILQTLGETKPISKVQAEEIVKMQKWAKDHARFASSYSVNKYQKIKDNTEISNLDLSDISDNIDGMKTSTEEKQEKREEQLKQTVNTRFSNIKKEN